MKIGVFGLNALRISYALSNQGLSCAITNTRDYAPGGNCPNVVLLSAATAAQAMIEVLALRDRNFCGQIVVLLSENTEIERIVDLYEAGADNCLAGDVEERLLVAVIKAASRIHAAEKQTFFTAGNLSLDTESLVARVDGAAIKLGLTGFHLLTHLLKNLGTTIPRETFHKEIWKNKFVIESIVDVYISRIRKEFKRAGVRGIVITGVRGVGYRLDVL